MCRFIEEARVASALNHPNIATIHELAESDGVRFMVMEYVEGVTLKEKVNGGPLDSSTIVALGCQIADALHAAHTAGIIHRDLKPSNIMITPQERPKVFDFGVAKRAPALHPHDYARLDLWLPCPGAIRQRNAGRSRRESRRLTRLSTHPTLVS
jgi:serine/threonine protein kinase